MDGALCKILASKRMVGVIGGGSLKLDGEFLGEEIVKTVYGFPSSPLKFVKAKDKVFVVLWRHGPDGSIPPHRINHRANIEAFYSVGVKWIIGVNSVGSLKRGLVPGSFLVPDDFICPWSILSFFDAKAVHITPVLDETLRQKLIKTCERLGYPCVPKGIYVQTLGPRLETKAEVRFLSQIGDVVGMTMAHEATLSLEKGLRYASLCTIDNYAHGVSDEPLDEAQIKQMARLNAEKVKRVLEEIEI